MKRWISMLLALAILGCLAPCALAETEEDPGRVAINLQAIKAALEE